MIYVFIAGVERLGMTADTDARYRAPLAMIGV